MESLTLDFQYDLAAYSGGDLGGDCLTDMQTDQPVYGAGNLKYL